MKGFLQLKRALYILTTLFLFNAATYAQQVISGKVVDRANEPIPGVTLIIKSTLSGTTTDLDGNFLISTDHTLPLTLTASFLGFKSEEIDVFDADKSIL